jgi:purine-binding chemotaxis protein CheW
MSSMNPAFGSPIELERSAAHRLDSEHSSQRGLGTLAARIEWLHDEQPRTTQSAIGAKQWFCLFHGDTGPMAVSVESVAQVLETDTLVRLAWNPPQVAGMCSYHREVIPVVVLGALSREAGEELCGNPDHPVATRSAGEKTGIAPRSRCVVLILRTEQGAWGLPVDSESTIVSRESPAYHAPRMDSNGPVVIGIVERAGTCYRIIDAAATWNGLRSAISRWFALINESNPSSPLPCREEPIPEVRGTSGGDRKA